ncbi:hypothetical protein [Romboutsia sp.]|uniref:hypothetical protein n=1 Tax=Romboutsia sp. TaxID=1965302 RepID=UPI002BEADAFC|nr:hypothetical protein [Romboutsia sp.]HSQ90196.1 hypothetical protein [Romboutsia sp.]
MKALDYKGKVAKEIEGRFNAPLESILHKLYIVDMKSAEDIADILGTSHVTVNKYLVRMGIKRRFDWKEIVKMCKERLKENEHTNT